MWYPGCKRLLFFKLNLYRYAEGGGAAAAMAEATGAKRRANWLEILSRALASGAETGVGLCRLNQVDL
jgi:hypothetical protein